jgi:hypothetical protein
MMYNSILNHNLFIREILNGALFPLCAFLSAIISLYLWDTFRLYGRGWTRQPGVATACAMCWVFAAEAVRAGTVWYLLRQHNELAVVSKYAQNVAGVLLLLGGLVLVITMLRCTYIFTPPRWGHRVWVAALLSTIVFLTISHFLPYI